MAAGISAEAEGMGRHNSTEPAMESAQAWALNRSAKGSASPAPEWAEQAQEAEPERERAQALVLVLVLEPAPEPGRVLVRARVAATAWVRGSEPAFLMEAA